MGFPGDVSLNQSLNQSLKNTTRAPLSISNSLRNQTWIYIYSGPYWEFTKGIRFQDGHRPKLEAVEDFGAICRALRLSKIVSSWG